VLWIWIQWQLLKILTWVQLRGITWCNPHQSNLLDALLFLVISLVDSFLYTLLMSWLILVTWSPSSCTGRVFSKQHPTFWCTNLRHFLIWFNCSHLDNEFPLGRMTKVTQSIYKGRLSVLFCHIEISQSTNLNPQSCGFIMLRPTVQDLLNIEQFFHWKFNKKTKIKIFRKIQADSWYC
jgi:hypothetical protein